MMGGAARAHVLSSVARTSPTRASKYAPLAQLTLLSRGARTCGEIVSCCQSVQSVGTFPKNISEVTASNAGEAYHIVN